MRLNRRILKHKKEIVKDNISRPKRYFKKIKNFFTKSSTIMSVISAILILFSGAFLNPIATSITNSFNEWRAGITYSIPPGSILRYQDKIRITIEDVDSIIWTWDSNSSHSANGTIADIDHPFGKGDHVLKFVGIKKNKVKETYTVNYTILYDAPDLQLSPQKTNFKPGEIITIKSADTHGIHQIGWAWDNEPTNPVFKTDHVKIIVPKTLGLHELRYYAFDDSEYYTFTGWRISQINITNDDTIDNNNNTIINRHTVQTNPTPIKP